MNKTETPRNIRGKINHSDIQELADNFFKAHINTEDVRLLVYIDYCLKNGGRINQDKVTISEENTIRHWCYCGYLEMCDEDHIKCISKNFYDIMCLILWDAYVNL